MVQIWANAHPDEVLSEALLAEDSLRQYLAPLANLSFEFGILLWEGGPPVRDHPPSPSIEGKGKKPRRMSSTQASFDDFSIPSGKPYEVLLITRLGSLVSADLPVIAALPQAMPQDQGEKEAVRTTPPGPQATLWVWEEREATLTTLPSPKGEGGLPICLLP